MKVESAVIPCAGKGRRLLPFTKGNSKTLIKIGKETIIEYLLDLCQKAEISDVFIITGKNDNQIQDYLKKQNYPFRIHFLAQEESNGIGNAILLAEPYIQTPFLVLLGDELYIKSNHEDMVEKFNESIDCLIGIKETQDENEIKKNYTFIFDGNKRITNLIEKPGNSQIHHNYFGTGSMIFNTKIFPAISQTKPSSLRNEVELIDSINTLIHLGGKIDYFLLKGDYININDAKDVQLAQDLLKK